jgi:hypothetical protein
MFNQLVQIAKPLLAMDCPWQSIIVAYASFLTMKGASTIVRFATCVALGMAWALISFIAWSAIVALG